MAGARGEGGGRARGDGGGEGGGGARGEGGGGEGGRGEGAVLELTRRVTPMPISVINA